VVLQVQIRHAGGGGQRGRVYAVGVVDAQLRRHALVGEDLGQCVAAADIGEAPDIVIPVGCRRRRAGECRRGAGAS